MKINDQNFNPYKITGINIFKPVSYKYINPFVVDPNYRFASTKFFLINPNYRFATTKFKVTKDSNRYSKKIYYQNIGKYTKINNGQVIDDYEIINEKPNPIRAVTNWTYTILDPTITTSYEVI